MIWLLLFSWLILKLQGWTLQAGVTLILLLRLRSKAWPRLKQLAPLLGFIVLLQLLFKQPLAGLSSGLKIANLSLLVLAYTSSVSTAQISRTFSFLGPTAGLLLTLTLNLIPVILNEAQNISLVQKTRSPGQKNPLAVIIPLLHRTFKRAEQLTIVLSLK